MQKLSIAEIHRRTNEFSLSMSDSLRHAFESMLGYAPARQTDNNYFSYSESLAWYAYVAQASTNHQVAEVGPKEYPEAAEVCAELYQVIGSLASDLNVFGHPLVIKALDNASAFKLVHKDVLPFPSFEGVLGNKDAWEEIPKEA